MSGDVPSNWREASLGQVATIQLGKKLDRGKEQLGKPLPYLRNVNVRWFSIETDDLLSMPFTEREADFYAIRDGDVLICEGGEPGRAAIWTGGPTDLKFQMALHRVRCGPLLQPEWLQLFLWHAANNGLLEPLFNGMTIRHLSGRALSTLSVPLPPLAEQRRIVGRIEALFARIRQARADLLRITPLSERYRLAVLRAALRGELTADWRSKAGALEPAERLVARTPTPSQPRGGREATDEVIPGVAALSVNHPRTEPPPGWAWVPLLRLARQESGHTPSRSVAAYWNGDIPWIGIRDAGAHHGGVIQDTAQHVTQAGLDNSSARLLPAQTVCLSRTASVGYVVVMGRPMATSQDFVTWTCSPALLPDFLKYALLAEGDDIRRFGKGSTHTTIYFPEIRALHICLPPLTEQHEIVRLLDQALPATANATHDADRAFILLDHLERSILSLAFRGELVPQDAADEPAAVTLSRFRATTPTPPPRRGRRRLSAPSNVGRETQHQPTS